MKRTGSTSLHESSLSASRFKSAECNGGGGGAEAMRIAIDDGDRRAGQFSERAVVPSDQRQIAADDEPRR